MKKNQLSIPYGLFQKSKPTVKNDRYVIYRLLNRKVTFLEPGSRRKISGFVQVVYRDIFEREIHITIDGVVYKFKEPFQLHSCETKVVFIYGNKKSKKELSDDVMFDEIRKSNFKETLSETFHRFERKHIKEITFKLGAKKPTRKKKNYLHEAKTAVVNAVGG